jgi:hypothetical protein
LIKWPAESRWEGNHGSQHVRIRAAGEKICGGKNITVEIKAGEPSIFEFSSRIPRSYGYLEDG